MARDRYVSNLVGSRRRALITKIGLDGHDTGAKVVARALRDAGFEVVYLGIRQSPSSIAATAIAEDVDAIGVSILSGAHIALVSDLMMHLRAREVGIPVVVGGLIPSIDRAQLMAVGVAAIANSGADRREIVDVMNAAIEANGASLDYQ